MTHTFRNIAPTAGEVAVSLPGDGLVPDPDVVMDRAFSVEAELAVAWPWLLQLGKHRAGWYLPGNIERFLPPSRRALRTLDPLMAGPSGRRRDSDYGGRDATFRVAVVDSPGVLVYESRRGRTAVSWAISATHLPLPQRRPATRIHLRLRLGPVRRPRGAERAVGLLDLLTIAGLAAGLAERVADDPAGRERRGSGRSMTRRVQACSLPSGVAPAERPP